MISPSILVVSRMFPHPDEPGSGPFVHEQVQALRQHGVDARVLCPWPFPFQLRKPLGLLTRWRAWKQAWANLHWQVYDDVPVVYAPYHVGQMAKLLRKHDPVGDSVRRAARWVKERFDFRLVHAHTAFPDGFAAKSLAKEHGVPFVITEHTGPFSLLLEEGKREKTVQALTAARRVWCVSDALCQEVRACLPADASGHVRTLYNGVDGRRFPLAETSPRDPLQPRFGFVGFLVEIKNLPILLEAFAQVRQAIPTATLTLLGDGPLRSALERQAGGGVTFLGARGRAEVAAFLREACDILVLPSRCETFGMVLIEALASGKPVVASRCGGPESIVTDPRLGTLCTANDITALADAMLATARRLPTFDPAEIRRLTLERFDLSNQMAELRAQYAEILTLVNSLVRRAQEGINDR